MRLRASRKLVVKSFLPGTQKRKCRIIGCHFLKHLSFDAKNSLLIEFTRLNNLSPRTEINRVSMYPNHIIPLLLTSPAFNLNRRSHGRSKSASRKRKKKEQQRNGKHGTVFGVDFSRGEGGGIDGGIGSWKQLRARKRGLLSGRRRHRDRA